MRTLLPVHYCKAEGELIVYLPLQLSGLCFVTQRVPARPTRPTAATGRPALPLSSPLPPARRLGHSPRIELDTVAKTNGSRHTLRRNYTVTLL